GIPYKGKILTGLSEFWFNLTRDIIPNHLITTKEEDFPPKLREFRGILRGRSMLVRKSLPIKIECVVRGYLAGSAYQEYKRRRSVGGIKLPSGLKRADKFPQPIFTPATKAASGHDINITKEKMKKVIGVTLTQKLEKISLEIYERASKYLESRGFILSDTKFEFGLNQGKAILIDELLTPDSSRFWSKKDYRPGHHQVDFDKQFVRDYLESLDWDKTPPAPSLSPAIIKKTSQRYLEAYERITGSKID
ncbi:phosphoribosylaminoimidazolesuccinocarboxamide synthase, partial [Candidatus Aerophobetes bacterium]|nr:phosphoribosylaminoimidazolesuccinocarboxamide synthase [Candidatus Aerophobetes bacterium]